MADDTSLPEARTAPGCGAPEYRQFNFWIGSWSVTAAGQLAGRNQMDSDLEGRALFESWLAVDGSRGRSINYYDRVLGRWHQCWVDDRGGALELDGAWSGGSMILEGERHDLQSGTRVRHRITWTPNADGCVRQHRQLMTSVGGGWETVFDGLYRRRR